MTILIIIIIIIIITIIINITLPTHDEPDGGRLLEHGDPEGLHPVLVQYGPVARDAVQDVKRQNSGENHLQDLQ
jgi:hypothetical protein